ncbi:unnamed protein product [Prorocentrum cordatum]|uniref:Uncharacterized protein n=1 Tax=Prorocentrum cordatum TaxID=2364126 RepID=A0ABN9XQT5_9DINO|nr:unnamed protein product [Polarella glacialis]
MKCYTPRAVNKRGARLISREARAIVQQLKPLRDQDIVPGVPLLLDMLICASDGSRATSTMCSFTRLSHESGVHQSKLSEVLGALSNCFYEVLKTTANTFSEFMLHSVRTPAHSVGDADPIRTIPIVQFRMRMYDGTKHHIRVVSPTPSTGPAAIVEASKSKYEVHVASSMRAYCLQQHLADHSVRTMTFAVHEPTLLQSGDGTGAEYITAFMNHIGDTALDKNLDDTFHRSVDLIISDEAGANIRYENGVRSRHPARDSLHLVCDAHKKAKVATLGSAAQGQVSTRIIRPQLSLRGNTMGLRHAMRELSRERLVIIHGACSDLEASRHRSDVIDTFMPIERAEDVRMREVVRNLFNGDWRRADRIEHYENGCCRSRAQTLHIMMTVGVRALTRRLADVMDRSNWTGSHYSVCGLGLATFVHNIFPSAYSTYFAGAASGTADPEEPAVDRAVDSGADVDEPKDPSVWREENKSRQTQTLSWLQSGCFRDDIYLFSRGRSRALSPSVGGEFGVDLSPHTQDPRVRQQKKLIDSGSRDYPIWAASDAKQVAKFTKQMTALIFDDGSWPLATMVTEIFQLDAHRACSRLAAAAYELVEVRHRKTPYKTFNVLRDDGATEEYLANTSECVLDTYTASWKEYYSSRGGIGGRMAKAELAGILPLMTTSTAFAERTHSENLQQSENSKLSWGIDLPSMSGLALFRQYLKWQTAIFRGLPKATAEEKRVEVRRAQRTSRPTPMGPWVWRAFVHIEANGVFVDAALGAELSARYAGLSAEERQPYEDLAAAALQEYRNGRPAFGKPPRRSSPARAARGMPTVRAVDGDAPNGVALADGEQDAASSVFESPIFKAATVKLMAHKRAAAATRRSDQAAEADLRTRSNAEADRHARDWYFIGNDASAADERPADLAIQRSMLPTAVFMRRRESVMSEVLRALDASSVEMESAKWIAKHAHAREVDCKPLDAPRRLRRLCWEAERCICQGPAQISKTFKHKLAVVWRVVEHAVGEKLFKATMAANKYVISFSFRKAPAMCSHDVVAGSGLEVVPAGDEVTLFFHIALHYATPWRPTFISMDREPSQDREGCLGLSPTKELDGPDATLGRYTLSELTTACFEDSWDKRPFQVAQFKPALQRVRDRPIVECDLWSVKPPPPKPRKRKRGGGPPTGPSKSGCAPIRDEDDEDGRDPELLEDGAVEGDVVESESDGLAPMVPATPMGSDEEWDLFGPSDCEGGPDAAAAIPHLGGGDGDVAAEPQPRAESPEPALPPPEDDCIFQAAAASSAAEGGAGPLPGGGGGPPEGRALALAIFHTEHDSIRFYIRTCRFTAECRRGAHLEHGNCVLSRTSRPSAVPHRAGQGRPLGLLFAWLLEDSCVSQHEHVRMFHPTLAARREARRQLLALAAGGDMTRDGEDDEPYDVPR